MEEIPVYWSFFWNWKVQRVRGVALQMFREMVFANYNRPSILLWGTNNEPFYFFNGGLGPEPSDYVNEEEGAPGNECPQTDDTSVDDDSDDDGAEGDDGGSGCGC